MTDDTAKVTLGFSLIPYLPETAPMATWTLSISFGKRPGSGAPFHLPAFPGKAEDVNGVVLNKAERLQLVLLIYHG